MGEKTDVKSLYPEELADRLKEQGLQIGRAHV